MKNNKIKKIDDASPLQGKVSAGDCLVSINGNRILDVLDYKFYAYDRHLHLELQKEDGSSYSLHVEKEEGGDLGL